MKPFLFEFEDMSWFPKIIRDGMLDYLRFILLKTKFYSPITPLLEEALNKSGQTNIIDLCSGGGGATEQVQLNLEKSGLGNVRILLTDKYPNIDAFKRLKEISNGKLTFSETPVDATEVDPTLKGLRTMFSAFHHFSPNTAKKILKDAVENNVPIAIFDGGDRSILTFLGIILGHPILFFFFTPTFRPFRLSRIFFTYLVPLIPICTVWDGVISLIRLYSPQGMSKLVKEPWATGYTWKTGKMKNSFGFKVAYLIGYPNNPI